MQKKGLKKNIILGVLFFLPVVFVLMLLPSKHNYNTLETVRANVKEITNFTFEDDERIALKDHITILHFLGNKPSEKNIPTLNLSQMVYGKFKGFKKFQIISLVTKGNEDQIETIKNEIGRYEDLKYWKFIYGQPEDIKAIHKSLNVLTPLNENLSTDYVYLIDKELNLRGRLDDRTDKEKEKNAKVYELTGYDCVSVDVLKNKMSDDLRVLFTEYRQKRKGNFDSSSRRADDLKNSDE